MGGTQFLMQPTIRMSMPVVHDEENEEDKYEDSPNLDRLLDMDNHFIK